MHIDSDASHTVLNGVYFQVSVHEAAIGQHQPIQVHLEATPTVFGVAYSLVSVQRIAAWV